MLAHLELNSTKKFAYRLYEYGKLKLVAVLYTMFSDLLHVSKLYS